MNYITAVLILMILLPHSAAYANGTVEGNPYQSLYSAGIISSNRLETDSYSDKSHKNNIGLMLGYRFSKYVAIEGNVENIGDYSSDIDSDINSDINSALSTNTVSFNISTINANLVGLLPVSDNIDLIGTIGLGFYFQSDESSTNTSDILDSPSNPVSDNPVSDSLVSLDDSGLKDHDIGFGQKLGIGFQYRPIKAVSIRFTQNLHLTMVSNLNKDSNRLKQITSSNLAIKYHFF